MCVCVWGGQTEVGREIGVRCGTGDEESGAGGEAQKDSPEDLRKEVQNSSPKLVAMVRIHSFIIL